MSLSGRARISDVQRCYVIFRHRVLRQVLCCYSIYCRVLLRVSVGQRALRCECLLTPALSVHRSASSPTWRTDVISSCGKTYRSVTCHSASAHPLSRAVSLVVGSAVSLVVGSVAVVENRSRLAVGCDRSHSGKTNQQRPYSIISQHLSNKPVRICAFPLA